MRGLRSPHELENYCGRIPGTAVPLQRWERIVRLNRTGNSTAVDLPQQLRPLVRVQVLLGLGCKLEQNAVRNLEFFGYPSARTEPGIFWLPVLWVNEIWIRCRLYLGNVIAKLRGEGRSD